MSFLLGLTGSIGMGKSTTASIFADHGCDIWNADAAVHRLYAQDGAAVAPLRQLFPDAIQSDAVDRAALRHIIAADPTALPRIEAIVHPLVRENREYFKQMSKADVLVFDIPLLFETGAEVEMNAVACVFIDAKEQRRRVLARGTMTAVQFEQILAKQMPIADKLARADYKIETDTKDHAAQQVRAILTEIREGQNHA
ncbi:dephospho-CoA kinase [Epibacterium ulvae]|uniref:dephospho-CoA kinase n=1 Tax=Epibacterium ulvae TaxID=1156985 RepID=UPI001BFC95CB|nr:dephospho-CoA kinase [Epibacterium ulvae]MBT8153604.1 dephospho-CoA kinase [Epibacterium ulvae]